VLDVRISVFTGKKDHFSSLVTENPEGSSIVLFSAVGLANLPKVKKKILATFATIPKNCRYK
jgi:hypothetical protein